MEESKSRSYRWLIVAIFVLYIAVLFYLVFLANEYGRNNSEILRYNDINLVPFKTINNYLNAWEFVSAKVIITNIFGNIAAFLPLGLLGPIVLPRVGKFWHIFFISLALSSSIEGIQGLLGVGVVDVDDLILNVLGAVIGYGIYVLLKIRMKVSNA